MVKGIKLKISGHVKGDFELLKSTMCIPLLLQLILLLQHQQQLQLRLMQMDLRVLLGDFQGMLQTIFNYKNTHFVYASYNKSGKTVF